MTESATPLDDLPRPVRWWATEEAKLFVLSAVALYFELLVVRWTNAYVKNVGFFTNFLVLASFVGLGAGFLLAKRKESFLATFPLLLSFYCVLVHVARPRLAVKDAGALFWGELQPEPNDESLTLGPELFVTLAYIVVALLFVQLGQPIGRALGRLPPLRAYATNIAGSLLGIALFTANSFVLATPVVWFGVVFVLLAPFYWGQRSTAAIGYVVSVGCLGFVAWLNTGSLWSPYYRTEVLCERGECALSGNGVWGQQLKRFVKAPTIYSIVHGEGDVVKRRHYADVLVIGSGAGNDVNVALHYRAEHVDAVEINPLILEIGRKLHPDKPYASPKVRLVTDDGRAFLRSTDRSYDLVAYGLPDSTGVVSSHANMRVESYLFTVEAFRAVRARLKPDGVFVLYNHYREPWLVEKIGGMLEVAFGQPALVFGNGTGTAVLMAGPGLAAIQNALPTATRSAAPPATDDWPFLYLKRPHIPQLYLRSLSIIAFLSLAIVALFAWLAARAEAEPQVVEGTEEASEEKKPSLKSVFRVDVPMFLMGAAFMLLEAKSIVTFGLLFGTTWLTTALVIGGILVMVLGAIFINHRFGVARLWVWGGLLALALAIVYVVPPERLVLSSPALRYIVGAALALSPVMFANVIFAKLLGETTETPRSLASNLIGSVFGGIAEYLSLWTGYRALLLVVAVLYGVAFLVMWRRSAGPFARRGLPR